MEASPAVDPIDRSRLPDTIGMSRPRVSTASTDWLAETFWKFAVVGNAPEVLLQVE